MYAVANSKNFYCRVIQNFSHLFFNFQRRKNDLDLAYKILIEFLHWPKKPFLYPPSNYKK